MLHASVVNDTLLKANYVGTDEEVPAQTKQHIATVEQLFILVQGAITMSAHHVDVFYHPELGYPEEVYIDYDAVIADDEHLYQLSQLEFDDEVKALNDVNWQLDAFITIAGPQPLVADTAISLSFNESNMTISGMAGCNAFGGDFELLDQQAGISITNIHSTEAWCENPDGVMAQENSFLAALLEVQHAFFIEGKLQLSIGADHILQFRPVPEIDDANWQLTAFITIAGPQPLITDTEITLSFNKANRTISGMAGCNMFDGNFEPLDQQYGIQITNIVATEVSCATPDGVMTQESTFLAALLEVQQAFFVDHHLQLVIGADNVLTFSAVD